MVLSRHFAATVLYAIAVILLLAILATVYWLWNEPSALYVAAPLGAAAASVLVLFHRSVATIRNDGRSLLYCRRFAKSGTEAEQRNQWLEAVLVKAARGAVVPVTLRDLSIPHPKALEKGISAAVGLVGFALAAGIFIGVGALLVVRYAMPGLLVFVIDGALLLIVLKGVHKLREWILATLGSHRATPSKVQLTLQRMLQRRHSRTDMLVVWSTDADWQAHVELMLGEASFAVVDVTTASENLNWEAQQAIQHLGADGVVFVQDDPSIKGLECVPTRLGEPFSAGDIWMFRFNRGWSYPQADGSVSQGLTQHVAAQAVREWLLHRRATRVDDAQAYAQGVLSEVRRTTRRTSLAYALLVTTGVLAVLLPMVTGGAGTYLAVLAIALLGGLIAFGFAHRGLPSAVFERRPHEAMFRGAAIVAGTFTTVYGAAVLTASISALLPADRESMLAIGMLFLIAIFPLLLVGAIVGLLVEYGTLRGPSLNPPAETREG